MADQGKELPSETLAQILRLLADGVTWAEIVRRVNVSKPTIWRKVPAHIRDALPIAFGKNPESA